MNQFTGKSNAEEDRAAMESLKKMDSSEPSSATEESTAANRKEIIKTNNHSPTRTNPKDNKLAVANRKEELKTIPKLADDKLKKPNQAKVTPNTNKPNRTSYLPTSKKPTPPRTSLMPNSKTTHPVTSKIPSLKHSPNNKTNIKNKPKARSTAAEQPETGQLSRSDSKLSTTESTVSKAELTTSKSTISSSAGVKEKLKIQTARTHKSPVASIQKRSASNISSRSTPSAVKREETQTNLRKITSLAGDHINTNNMEKKISSRSPTPIRNVRPETNLRKMLSTAGDQNKIDVLEQKLEEAQTEFLEEMDNLKESLPDNLKYDYKFITVVRNEECKLMVKDDVLLKMPQLFPADAVSDFKEKIRLCMDNYFAALLDNLRDTNESSPMNVEAKDKLQQLQILKSNNILELIDDLCSIQEEGCDAQIVKMQKELQDSKKTLKTLEKSLSDSSKQHKEELLNLAKELKSKAETDLAHKDAEMKDLNRKLNHLKTTLQNTEKEDKADKSHLQEEIKTSRESNSTLQKRLHTLEQQLMSERKELKTKNESIKKLEIDLEEKKKLATNLADMTKKMQELKDIPKTSYNCAEHLQQIAELQNVVSSLEIEKQKMETKTEKLESEVAALVVVQAKLKDAENCLHELQRKLEAKENTEDTQADYVKDAQMEFAKFRQADAEKRREIEKLKIELSKFQYNMCQLEEEIQRGQQLLEVRCELINSLQTNEKTQRIHMEELFAQVAEKNNTINELNSELHTKSEEFRNLFTTISAKQMELSNQEHMIKLLEDSNERSQMLRVKQEEKIGRMEEELAHLKQTISIYQANILSGNHGKNVLYTPILPASNGGDYNENFYYYASQRRRKRQVDINVKKYEA